MLTIDWLIRSPTSKNSDIHPPLTQTGAREEQDNFSICCLMRRVGKNWVGTIHIQISAVTPQIDHYCFLKPHDTLWVGVIFTNGASPSFHGSRRTHANLEWNSL